MSGPASQPWLHRAALAADRRAVDRAVDDRLVSVGDLLAAVPALLRLVAASEMRPAHASPGFALARDHGSRAWVATLSGAADQWTTSHEDLATAVRATMRETLAALDALTTPG